MKKHFLALCLLCSSAIAAQAQMKLTLEQSLELALSSNTTIKVADLEVERYDYVKRETWGNLLPQVSVSGVYDHAIVKEEIAEGFSMGSDNTISMSLDFGVALYAPAVYRTMKMNDLQRTAAVESARGSKITLLSEVKKSFYNILLAQENLKVVEESYSLSSRVVKDTKLMYDNSLVSEYDLLTAQVNLNNLEPTMIQLKNGIESAKLMLKMYLSIPKDVTIEVTGDLNNIYDAIAKGAIELSTDINNNSDLKGLELQTDILRQQLKVSNSSRLPTLSAYASVSLNATDMDGSAFTGVPYDGSLFWRTPVSAGLSLSVPIFAGLTNTNRAKQLKNSIAQLELQQKYTRDGLDVQVKSALDNLVTARETMKSQEKTVTVATKAYNIASVRYKSATGTILELNSAQLSLTQAQLNFSQATFDYLSSLSDYEKVVGNF